MLATSRAMPTQSKLMPTPPSACRIHLLSRSPLLHATAHANSTTVREVPLNYPSPPPLPHVHIADTTLATCVQRERINNHTHQPVFSALAGCKTGPPPSLRIRGRIAHTQHLLVAQQVQVNAALSFAKPPCSLQHNRVSLMPTDATGNSNNRTARGPVS
jgi:hypothetical protein